MGLMKAHTPVGALVLAVAAVLGLIIFGVIPIKGTADTHGQYPYEYVYLDPARVKAYLGQIDGGDVNQETRTATFKDSKGATIAVNAVGQVSNSASDERVASAVVSFSEADDFFKLEKKLLSEEDLKTIRLGVCCSRRIQQEYEARLRALEQRLALAAKPSRNHPVQSGRKPGGESHKSPEQVGLEEFEAEAEDKLEGLPIGEIVKLEGAFLRVPPYLAAYPSLRYAPYRYHTHNGVLGNANLPTLNETEVTLGKHVRSERAQFISDAGANPRVPFSTKQHRLTIVIPARYDYITGDPSLLGTDVTIVGKVVYKGEGFGDAASESTYLPALLKSSQWFLEDIGFQQGFLDKYTRRCRRSALDHQLFQALQRSLTFTGAVIEIVPIAIYS